MEAKIRFPPVSAYGINLATKAKWYLHHNITDFHMCASTDDSVLSVFTMFPQNSHWGKHTHVTT